MIKDLIKYFLIFSICVVFVTGGYYDNILSLADSTAWDYFPKTKKECIWTLKLALWDIRHLVLIGSIFYANYLVEFDFLEVGEKFLNARQFTNDFFVVLLILGVFSYFFVLIYYQRDYKWFPELWLQMFVGFFIIICQDIKVIKLIYIYCFIWFIICLLNYKYMLCETFFYYDVHGIAKTTFQIKEFKIPKSYAIKTLSYSTLDDIYYYSSATTQEFIKTTNDLFNYKEEPLSTKTKILLFFFHYYRVFFRYIRFFYFIFTWYFVKIVSFISNFIIWIMSWPKRKQRIQVDPMERFPHNCIFWWLSEKKKNEKGNIHLFK